MRGEIVIRGEMEEEAKHKEIRVVGHRGKKMIKRKLKSSKTHRIIKG